MATSLKVKSLCHLLSKHQVICFSSQMGANNQHFPEIFKTESSSHVTLRIFNKLTLLKEPTKGSITKNRGKIT